MNASEPGPFAPGDAFERLGVLETLSYGIVWEGKRFRASQSEPLTLVELAHPLVEGRDRAESLRDAIAAVTPLSDPGIVSCQGIASDGAGAYLVCEALSGMSLARALEALAAVGARFSTEAVLRVAGAVLGALEQASRQLPGSAEAPGSHGLLTPENVFLAEGQRVLVRGFGIWPQAREAALVRPTEARYLAPGQLETGLASPRSDLISLGTILFELVCGLPAFDGAPDEEALSSLRETIAERRKKAEASTLPVYDAMLGCLSLGPPAPAFRGRLRKHMDTLFLDELSRERGPRTYSIEDLLERARSRRAAVVKARSISLQKFTGASPVPVLVSVESVPEIEVAVPAPAAAAPAPVPTRPAPRRPSPRLLAVGGVLLFGLVWAVLRSRGRAGAIPVPQPTAIPLKVLVERPGAPPVEATPVPVTPLAGSLVALDTPGLVPPVLAPETAGEGKGARPRLARLEILVDETGRVREKRFLDGAARSPEDLEAVDSLLETLRFQPARLGSMPVRVRMPFDLRY